MTVQINHSLEDRRQVFLKAAEALFAQHGFERRPFIYIHIMSMVIPAGLQSKKTYDV
jgi:hypothetical protein